MCRWAINASSAPGHIRRLADAPTRGTEGEFDEAGAAVFACLPFLTGHPESAQFWWQLSAGAGNRIAAYCLHLHHLAPMTLTHTPPSSGPTPRTRRDLFRWGRRQRRAAAGHFIRGLSYGAGITAVSVWATGSSSSDPSHAGRLRRPVSRARPARHDAHVGIRPTRAEAEARLQPSWDDHWSWCARPPRRRQRGGLHGS